MMRRAVLFDFHNTLATCDRWLRLEIRLLPALALERLAAHGAIDPVATYEMDRAVELFRALRQDVRDSGIELSAIEGCRRVLEEMRYTLSDRWLEQVVAELEEECLPEVRLVPGADRAVRALLAAGYVLGVVSSAGYPPFVLAALESLGLLDAFEVVVTSAEEGLYKSDPEIFRRAVSRLAAEPGLSVHVGDHAIYDVRTAQLAGLSAVWFTGEARRTSLLHDTPWNDASHAGEEADAVVADMDGLYAAILALVGS
jgi:HAD superfamily hydrolase (TIGR01549 family)